MQLKNIPPSSLTNHPFVVSDAKVFFSFSLFACLFSFLSTVSLVLRLSAGVTFDIGSKVSHYVCVCLV